MKNNFDERFQALQTEMIEIAFEFVGFNEVEVDKVFVFGSLEAGDPSFNIFYEINGTMVQSHQINTVLKKKCDISDDRILKLLTLGNDYLYKTIMLFEEFDREVPTLMRMVFSPIIGKFSNDISYELHYSNDENKIVTDVLDDWFQELGGKLD